MVEAKPALLYLSRQTGQSFIDSTPFSEYFQTFRTPFSQCFFEMEHSQIVDIMVEIYIHPYHFVVEQEPAGFGKLVVSFTKEDGTDC